MLDELDGSLVKSRRLERANREIAERLDAAIGTIRDVLGTAGVAQAMAEEEAEESEEADEAEEEEEAEEAEESS